MANKYFSVTAMFVMFREVLEAAVIMAVVLQLLTKLGASKKLKNQVWWGAGAGLLASILFGVIFVGIYYALDKEVFEGNGEAIFEGVIMIIASIMITVLAFGMLKILAMKDKWEVKLTEATEQAFTGTKKYGIFFLVFLSVIREGIESVLFLTGVGQDNWTAIPIAGIVGAILGGLFGYLLFYSFKPLHLKWFCYVSGVILFFIAAGLFTHGVHEFQEAQAFGSFEKEDKPTPWHNRAMWNICKCCPHGGDNFWALLRALVYYACDPSFLEMFAYLSYWIVVIAILVWKWRDGTLTMYKTKPEAYQSESAKPSVIV